MENIKYRQFPLSFDMKGLVRAWNLAKDKMMKMTCGVDHTRKWGSFGNAKLTFTDIERARDLRIFVDHLETCLLVEASRRDECTIKSERALLKAVKRQLSKLEHRILSIQ